MPRYYFHLRYENDLIWDVEGEDLPDPGIARAAAQKTADGLHDGLLYRTDSRTPWTIAVTDEGGEIIHFVSL